MEITPEQFWVVFSSVVTIASIVVKITPTLKDDHWFKIFIKFFGALSLNNKMK